MKTRSIQQNLSKRILILRSIERILKSEEFNRLYEMLEDTSRVDLLIKNDDKEGLNLWLKRHSQKETETLRKLRSKAKALCICNWYNLTKDQLLYELQKYDFPHTIKQNLS